MRRPGPDASWASMSTRRMDFGDPLRIARGFGLGEERSPLAVGRKDEIDERFRAALVDAAEPGACG